MLVRVNPEPEHRAEIMRTADIFRAKIVDVTPQSFTIEETGEEGKLEALVELLRPMGIQEIVRTGRVATAAGPKTRRRDKPSPAPNRDHDRKTRMDATAASRHT